LIDVFKIVPLSDPARPRPVASNEKGPHVLTHEPQLQRCFPVLTVCATLLALRHPLNRADECSKCGTLAFDPSGAFNKEGALNGDT